MATITAVRSEAARGVEQIFYETLTGTNSDGSSILIVGDPNGGARDGSFQVTGTFNSTTVVLQVSNDGSTWTTANDVDGSAVSHTAAGMSQFRTAATYLRPLVSAGSGGDHDVTIILR